MKYAPRYIRQIQPCSSPVPAVKRISSPTSGLIPMRRNFFLHRRTYSAPSSVRAV